MATILGCTKCHNTFPHDGCVKDPWPAVCSKGGMMSWAGSAVWEKQQAEEFAKQPSHSQPDWLEVWASKPVQERFFFGTLV